MSDLIDRQALLDAFSLSERTRKFGGDHSGYDTRMLYEIQDVIEGMPSAEPERRWIPCSERLPEDYGEYFVTWTTSDHKKPLVAICEAEETGEWDSEHDRFKVEWLFDDFIKMYSNVKVIAWMTLPEPYKEVKHE